MNNKNILEISCGRGGNLNNINENFLPNMLVGMHICCQNVLFGNSYISGSKTLILVGDAEKPPFSDESFDVVINIESSSHYPNINKFYENVYRL